VLPQLLQAQTVGFIAAQDCLADVRRKPVFASEGVYRSIKALMTEETAVELPSTSWETDFCRKTS
jgi:hypothetical protein